MCVHNYSTLQPDWYLASLTHTELLLPSAPASLEAVQTQYFWSDFLKAWEMDYSPLYRRRL